MNGKRLVAIISGDCYGGYSTDFVWTPLDFDVEQAINEYKKIKWRQGDNYLTLSEWLIENYDCDDANDFMPCYYEEDY